jgi:hypothetical protein
MSDPDRFRLRAALTPAQRTVLVLALLAGAVMGGCPPWLEVRTQIPASNNENLRPVSTVQAAVYAPWARASTSSWRSREPRHPGDVTRWPGRGVGR